MAMKVTAVSVVYLFLIAWIVAILPTACDREYEIEHPTDVYISPSDELAINWNDKTSK